MIGSPNYVRFVYDGEVPTLPFGDLPPEGSKEIENVFLDYFDSQHLDTESIPFDSRSDYQSFFDEGIPAGGIISGDADKKTVEQAATYGGVPGLAYDPCYHQECDTLKDELQSAEVNQVEARLRRRCDRGQRQHQGFGRDVRCGSARNADVRPDALGGHWHRQRLQNSGQQDGVRGADGH